MKKFHKKIRFQIELLRNSILKKVLKNMKIALKEGSVLKFTVAMGQCNMVVKGISENKIYDINEAHFVCSKAVANISELFEEYNKDFYLASQGFMLKEENGEIMVAYEWSPKEGVNFEVLNEKIFFEKA